MKEKSCKRNEATNWFFSRFHYSNGAAMAGSLFMISRFPYSFSFPPSLVHEDLLLKCSRSSIHVWAKKRDLILTLRLKANVFLSVTNASATQNWWELEELICTSFIRSLSVQQNLWPWEVDGMHKHLFRSHRQRYDSWHHDHP